VFTWFTSRSAPQDSHLTIHSPKNNCGERIKRLGRCFLQDAVCKLVVVFSISAKNHYSSLSSIVFACLPLFALFLVEKTVMEEVVVL